MSGHPRLGIAYRRQIASEIFDHRSEFECLEILVEHFMPLTSGRRTELERLREEFTLIPHGVGLSPGSLQPPGEDYFQQVRELVEIIEAPFMGEHASVSRGAGYDLRHLSPLWRTRDALERLIANLELTMDRLGVPVALETITETHVVPGAELEADDFLVEAVTRAGASLLIDVTNVWVNRENGVIVNQPGLYGSLGSARWSQFHLAGISRDDDGFLVDSHDSALPPAVVDAYREAVAIQAAPFAIVERDGDLQAFDELIDDLGALRRVHQEELSSARA